MEFGSSLPKNGANTSEYWTWIGRRGVIMVCKASNVTSRMTMSEVLLSDAQPLSYIAQGAFS
jgi:hypothetical protein